jgi:hypothetical protein
MSYSGGDMWNISGGPEGTGVFQHVYISQGFLGRDWAVNLSDEASYMPQAATTGFSGIPGVGNLSGLSSAPSQPILTLNTRSVYNSVNPSFTHSLNHATSLGFSGSYGTLRFPDGDGLETDSLQGGPQITRRLNALNSLLAQYVYSRFSYPGYNYTMETQSVPIGYTRTWSRRLSTGVSVGPEWIQSSGSLNIPSSSNLTVGANAVYTSRTTSYTMSYTQGASGGAGVLTEVGVHNHDLNAALTRQFGGSLSISASGAYMRTTGLQQGGVTNGEYGGVAATRRLGQFITVFANYTAIEQSSTSVLTTNAISGLVQVVGFGIGYSPREMRFKK